MFHPDTQFLIDHWTALSRRPGVRGGIPGRADLRPEALGARLPRAFIAQRSADSATIGLAGGWIEGFHGTALKGQSLGSLWREESSLMVSQAVGQTLREARPVVIAACAGDLAIPLEVLLAPLRSASGRPDQLLGFYAPSATLSLAKDESRALTARLSVGVGPISRAPLSLAAVYGRRLA